MKSITKTVWILSFISLFTDMASEMLYPVMPIYLKSIGFSVVLIGVLEGVAEATAGISKGYFGKLSDATGKRMPFVQWGYALSAMAKPMMGLLPIPLWIFCARTLDRMGKGLRTGARDAILSGEATPATKATVFGLHRSMDTLGAVIGPLLALAYLAWRPAQYQALFLIAFVPGVLAIAASVLLKDKNTQPKAGAQPVRLFSFLQYWRTSPAAYRKLVTGLLLFALFNSSDVFLLLKAKETGMSDTLLIGIYIFYNLIYAMCALPLGILADRVGLKKIFIIGLLLFAVVYAGMAYAQQPLHIAILFALYGIYAAATEGVSKAWISNITPKTELGTAIGSYAGLQSICAMAASTLAGLLWFSFGSAITLMVSGLAVVGVAAYMVVIRYQRVIND